MAYPQDYSAFLQTHIAIPAMALYHHDTHLQLIDRMRMATLQVAVTPAAHSPSPPPPVRRQKAQLNVLGGCSLYHAPSVPTFSCTVLHAAEQKGRFECILHHDD